MKEKTLAVTFFCGQPFSVWGLRRNNKQMQNQSESKLYLHLLYQWLNMLQRNVYIHFLGMEPNLKK